MTTITRLKQLRDWLNGKLFEERVKRQPPQPLLPTRAQTLLYSLAEYVPDRFASYRQKIIPTLRICGYGYFLSCESNDYVEHQRWCDEHCIESSLPHCDVWQIDTKYARAFASKADAAMFKLTFGASNIE